MIKKMLRERNAAKAVDVHQQHPVLAPMSNGSICEWELHKCKKRQRTCWVHDVLVLSVKVVVAVNRLVPGPVH